jgi:hypothetical protein
MRCVNEKLKHWPGEPGYCMDSVLEDCEIDLFFPIPPSPRPILSRLTLHRCKLASWPRACLVVDTMVRDLATSDLAILWGTVFERTQLSGKVGRLRINAALQSVPDPAQQATYDLDRLRHYERVAWALDVSEARPSMLEIEGIPGSRLILDDESQCVLSRSRAVAAGLSSELLGNVPPTLAFIIDDFLASPEEGEERIIIAPTGQAKARVQPWLRALRELRSMGVLVPTGARPPSSS